MTPLIRLSRLALAARSAPRIGPLDESVVRFRAWPNDVDLNLHVNNGRYLTIMDLGRFDLIARNGLLRVAIDRRCIPLVGTAMMHYYRSIQPLTRYELRTRAIGWDEKWFYIDHRFVQNGTVMASGVIKGLFRGKSGNVRPGDMLAAAGHDLPSPPLPSWVERWISAANEWTAEA